MRERDHLTGRLPRPRGPFVMHMYKDPFTGACGKRLDPDKDAVTVRWPGVRCIGCLKEKDRPKPVVVKDPSFQAVIKL